MSKTVFIVIGGLNTDIIGLGVDHLAGPGELVTGKQLRIGPGGKSRNIAQMLSSYTETAAEVVMVGRTAKDPYGLWQAPLSALREAGVNTEHIVVEDEGMPGIALIPVNEAGENQITLLPGANSRFSQEDIDASTSAFDAATRGEGMLLFSLEVPTETALHAVRKAKECGIRVAVDPGGMRCTDDLKRIMSEGIFLLKPNEHEAKMLTGIEICDEKSAAEACIAIRLMGSQHVMITAGAEGAYVFSDDRLIRIPAPSVPESGVKDATGCGDQTMAVLCAEMCFGKTLHDSAAIAVTAGTLQFGRAGISPLNRAEVLTITSR